jgi:hypothetical protein
MEGRIRIANHLARGGKAFSRHDVGGDAVRDDLSDKPCKDLRVVDDQYTSRFPLNFRLCDGSCHSNVWLFRDAAHRGTRLRARRVFGKVGGRPLTS